MRIWITIICLLLFTTLRAQLSNDFFRITPAMPQARWGTTFEALQFLKNNEYFNNINPGETLFGFQAKGLLHYRLHEDATFSVGALLQRDFGDTRFLTKAIPIFNINIHKPKWQFNLGNIQPNIFHNLPEPMLNYENLMTQPVEAGLQAKRKTKKMFYDGWLEWRQKMDENTGRQEIIIFGQSLEENLVKVGPFTLSAPLHFTIYHRGGQFNNSSGVTHLATRINGGAGLRLKSKDSALVLETYYLRSFDNSPTPTQPFKDGWGSMTNLRFRFKKYHQVALTWWYCNEYQTTLGAQVFTSVNLSNPYLNNGLRRLAMLRYVFSRPIVGHKLWIDFRFEPYYDLEYKKVEFSNGLYFRYVSTLDLKLPGWLRF